MEVKLYLVLLAPVELVSSYQGGGKQCFELLVSQLLPVPAELTMPSPKPSHQLATDKRRQVLRARRMEARPRLRCRELTAPAEPLAPVQ